MGRCRFLAAWFICAFLLNTALAAEFVETPENGPAASLDQPPDFVILPDEPPENVEIVENSPSEVIVSDDAATYHISADTIIIQPVDTSPSDSPEELSEDTPLDDMDGNVEGFESSLETPLDAPEEPAAPLPVVVVPSEEDFPSLYASGSGLNLDIDDIPPASPLFYGAIYVTGTDSRLGTVTVYFPANYQSGVLGLDSSGCLCSVYSGSVSGYLSGVNNNRVSLSTFSRPTYSQYSGSSTQTYTLSLRPTSTNAQLLTSSLPRMSFDQLYPYLMIFLLGVIVCFIKRS